MRSSHLSCALLAAAAAQQCGSGLEPAYPALVVFDLDFTLWYPELYELDRPRGGFSSSDGSSFFKPIDGGLGGVETKLGEELRIFDGARRALIRLSDAGVSKFGNTLIRDRLPLTCFRHVPRPIPPPPPLMCRAGCPPPPSCVAPDVLFPMCV